MLPRLIFAFLIISQSSAQNDEKKDVEWDVNDPRWDTKIPNWWEEDKFVSPVGPVEERTKEFWVNRGQQLLHQKVEQKLNTNKAKNLVIFIGDGMGLATLMATRSYIGDVQNELSFEKFPHTGLSKTYCINYQIPDSSCTATAILTGVKNNFGTIGLTGDVNLRNCTAEQDKDNHLNSIFKYAQDAGKSTGIITTTRVTHATPAAAYASTSSRYWESNEGALEGCPDIAYQLVHGEVGSNIDVIFGGGLRNFLPNNMGGARTDNRSLIADYNKIQSEKNMQHKVLYNRSELTNLDASKVDKAFGLFAQSHLEYKLLSDPQLEPTLEEMTLKALEILKKNENGFVLLVEGGRIDTAHHETSAKLALEETREFQKAVQSARDMTNEEDSLIVVTADHSTALSAAGFMPRGYNILGPGDYSRSDNMWFFTLSYANGPGYADHTNENGGRIDPRGKSYLDPRFRQPTTVNDFEETHAGEDVGVYASGPFSHIFTGVYEQNFLHHAMTYATCLGPKDFKKHPQCSGAISVKGSSAVVFVVAILSAVTFSIRG